MPTSIKNKVFAFDLDGTIYTGNRLVEGAYEIVNYLRQRGAKVVFFTNSSTRSVQQVYDKLKRMGLNPTLEDIHTSARAAAIYTSKKYISQVHCIGTDGLKSELQSFGVRVTDAEYTAEAIVIGLDPDFSYAKLSEIMPYRETRCLLIACNRDKSYPIENNIYLPGCGPIVAAVEEALGRNIDFITGKPNTFMLDILSHQLDCNNTDITVIGDSYESDIQMAMRYGVKSFLLSTTRDAKITDSTIQISNIIEIRDYL